MGEDLEEESAYRGAAFALLTQHGKEAAIGPIFARAFDAAVRRVDGFDTDTLGTFTRDVPRAGSQLEAARRKARLAIELAGLPRGLGSEGSFAPGPFGLGTWNLELVVLIDDARGIEIIGRAQGAATCAHALVRTRDELEALARRAEFPAHGLVVRPDASEDPASGAASAPGTSSRRRGTRPARSRRRARCSWRATSAHTRVRRACSASPPRPRIS